ncbi:glucosamine-6-phosphate deaminase [Palleronia aestuarii]|uniref:Glucosamine-6-phosphate deaminase n=1 Tax=Palleronia aestuarii TaxID=568105 RepID=A0A2W7MZX0_9RHOB|nr:glucosamine-6-phosphate deaminase [Palleronia aestuarii]PZX11717.1 glucosamine-6-phosphate deaminase [Palleronia aestuarii]
MKVLILPDAQKAADRTAEVIAATVTARPDATLGLATGGTMEGVYEHLVTLGPDMSRSTTFNLDEYVGLSPDHPQSYRRFMQTHLFDPLGMPRKRTHLPRGDAPDPEAEARRYERAIADAGGIDLQLLGIGRNGHIGFNEPSSSLGSRCRIKTLTRATRDANSRFFASLDEVPRHAITMGIATILDARRVVLLATGSAKARAVADMVEGPISARCPASALQLHPAADIICDEAAAAELRLREYYETVHPGGAEADVTGGCA